MLFAMLKTSIPREEGAPRRTGRLASKSPYQLNALIHGSREGRREVPHRGRRGRKSIDSSSHRVDDAKVVSRARDGQARDGTSDCAIQRLLEKPQNTAMSQASPAQKTGSGKPTHARRRFVGGDQNPAKFSPILSLQSSRAAPEVPTDNNGPLIRRREQGWRCVCPAAYVAASEVSTPLL